MGKIIKIKGNEYVYRGETDLEGNAAGWGRAEQNRHKFEGTFLNDKLEGVIRETSDKGYRFVQEFY